MIKVPIENHPKSVSSFDNAKDKTMGSSDASAIYAGDASPLYAFTRDNEYENESSSFRCWHCFRLSATRLSAARNNACNTAAETKPENKGSYTCVVLI